MKVIFSEKAMDEYIEWQSRDKKTLKRINALIHSIQREGYINGIGKPEMLKNRKAYSRRIDDFNRLIYSSDPENNVVIISCAGHYID